MRGSALRFTCSAMEDEVVRSEVARRWSARKRRIREEMNRMRDRRAGHQLSDGEAGVSNGDAEVKR